MLEESNVLIQDEFFWGGPSVVLPLAVWKDNDQEMYFLQRQNLNLGLLASEFKDHASLTWGIPALELPFP